MLNPYSGYMVFPGIEYDKFFTQKAVSLDFYRWLHDYFRDHDVRNAHVLSINNVGDFAVSYSKVGRKS